VVAAMNAKALVAGRVLLRREKAESDKMLEASAERIRLAVENEKLKKTGSEVLPRASTLFPPNPIKGISAGWRRFLSIFIMSKVLEKIISAELPVSTSIFSMVQP